MKTEYLVIAVVAVIGLVIAAELTRTGKNRNRRKLGKFTKKKLFTEREEAMYWRLAEAFPPSAFVVLGQVSLGALLTTAQTVDRNRYDRKIADFVVTNKAFSVAAVIELDDKSHRGKEQADTERDKMLQQAGYRTLRYKEIPDVATLRRDLMEGR